MKKLGEFHLCFLIPALLIVSGCNQSKTVDQLPQDDKKEIIAMMREYREGWIVGDSAKVLHLFADTAIIVPSGLKPIRGKSAMIQFWWPNDGSKTTIEKYEIKILEINSDDKWAYVFENGKLSWTYEKQGLKMKKDQQSYEITIFKKTGNNWKIVRRIWTDLKT